MLIKSVVCQIFFISPYKGAVFIPICKCQNLMLLADGQDGFEF